MTCNLNVGIEMNIFSRTNCWEINNRQEVSNFSSTMSLHSRDCMTASVEPLKKLASQMDTDLSFSMLQCNYDLNTLENYII